MRNRKNTTLLIELRAALGLTARSLVFWAQASGSAAPGEIALLRLSRAIQDDSQDESTPHRKRVSALHSSTQLVGPCGSPDRLGMRDSMV